MSRPSARRLVPALAVFCWLSASAADDPRKTQAPAGVPKKAGIPEKAGGPARDEEGRGLGRSSSPS